MFANTTDELERFCIGIVGGAQLDFDRFGGKVRKALLKFSIQNKGQIGIKLLLQLEELELLPCPGTDLVHGKNNLIGASVVRQCIENTGVFQTIHW